jgi:hypothetical protein
MNTLLIALDTYAAVTFLEEGQFDGMVTKTVLSTTSSSKGAGITQPFKKELFPLFMSVFSQSFLSFMRRYFMTFSLFTTWHTSK